MVDEAEREPEHIVEYSSLRDEEVQVAREQREAIEAHGAADILIKERENHPNKVYIYAHTEADAEAAAEYYNDLKRDV